MTTFNEDAYLHNWRPDGNPGCFRCACGATTNYAAEPLAPGMDKHAAWRWAAHHDADAYVQFDRAGRFWMISCPSLNCAGYGGTLDDAVLDMHHAMTGEELPRAMADAIAAFDEAKRVAAHAGEAPR